MIKAAEYALSGLQNAGRQFETAARTIVGDPSINETHTRISQASGNTDTNTNTGSGQSSGKPPGSLLTSETTTASQSQDAPSLTEGLVSLKEAEVSYKANAAVVSALQETQDRVLEILA